MVKEIVTAWSLSSSVSHLSRGIEMPAGPRRLFFGAELDIRSGKLSTLGTSSPTRFNDYAM